MSVGGERAEDATAVDEEAQNLCPNEMAAEKPTQTRLIAPHITYAKQSFSFKSCCHHIRRRNTRHHRIPYPLSAEMVRKTCRIAYKKRSSNFACAHPLRRYPPVVEFCAAASHTLKELLHEMAQHHRGLGAFPESARADVEMSRLREDPAIAAERRVKVDFNEVSATLRDPSGVRLNRCDDDDNHLIFGVAVLCDLGRDRAAGSVSTYNGAAGMLSVRRRHNKPVGEAPDCSCGVAP